MRSTLRREYTPAFKRHAMEQARRRSVYAAARELGLAEQTLRNWVNKMRTEDSPVAASTMPA
ncbi:transposase [Pelomonas sp. SE-A7]|uniref:transposase n=1 Tax=Pelomonas sp. SE-A7 TaxID=3054953 RepID=UPI00259CA457|nr:transposase [Pelomonas sp. SE-A7]MDM4768172.1 transposase [Pelomonas sp. SE-A7]